MQCNKYKKMEQKWLVTTHYYSFMDILHSETTWIEYTPKNSHAQHVRTHTYVHTRRLGLKISKNFPPDNESWTHTHTHMHCAPHIPPLWSSSNSPTSSIPLAAVSPLTWCCCRADLAKGCPQNWHGMRASSAVRGSGRWEDNKEWAQATYVCMYICSSHCPPNELHAFTSKHECTSLKCGDTWNTLHWQGFSNLPSPRTGGESVWPRTWEEYFLCFKEDLQLACIVRYTQPTEYNKGSK